MSVEDGSTPLTSLTLPACDLPVDGVRLFELALAIAPVIGYYLPSSTPDSDLAHLTAMHASRRCERVSLIWGKGRKARPRALLACFRMGLPPRMSATPPGVFSTCLDCRSDHTILVPPSPSVPAAVALEPTLIAPPRESSHIRFYDAT
mmetsp:Transcript_33/g.112  ORF Transcript_33/g.112 Transcript_33/m.112 type:complete len:148 (-) Transcript_33:112-555(-)